MSSRWADRLRYALAVRLALWHGVLFALGALALVGLTYLLLARSLQARDHQLIVSTLDRYANEYQAGGLVALDRAISADRVQGRHERLLVRVTGRGAQAIFFNIPAGWGEFDLSRLNAVDAREAIAWTWIPGRRNRVVLEVASVRLMDGTLVQVGRSSDARQELLEHFRSRALVAIVIIAAIAVLGGATLTAVGLAPLRDLAGTVRTIVTTGRLDSRVTVRATGDELDELGQLVNVMLDRIQTLIGGMRGALDNVAHDLRTPLMRVRSVLESALTSEEPEVARDALARALEEVERVDATLTTLMDISEAETGTLKLNREPLVLAAVVGEAVDLYADVAEEKGVTLDVQVPGGIVLTADRARLRQVLANLVDNAVKYTPSGGRVEIGGRIEGHEAIVDVVDTGIGIAPGDLPRVWERLYRADASRSERGLGLGLSLVKAVVEAHGGRVAVRSSLGEGSVFTVALPASGTATSASPA
jgi:signal transduction histidine kinase